MATCPTIIAQTRCLSNARGRKKLTAALRSDRVGAVPGTPDDNNFSPTRVAAFAGADQYGAESSRFDLVEATLAALSLPASFIQTGDRVALKPNWIKEHDERFPGARQWEHVITHPAVIEAVARWAAAKLQGGGSITICDAPQ